MTFKRFYLDSTDPANRVMRETPPDADIPGAFMYVEDHEKIVRELTAAKPEVKE